TYQLGRLASADQDWPAVLARLAPFERELGTQGEFSSQAEAPSALALLVEAALAQHDLARARAAGARLAASFPSDANNGRVALELYCALRVEAERAGDATGELQRAMLACIARVNEAAREPSLDGLRIEAALRL